MQPPASKVRRIPLGDAHSLRSGVSVGELNSPHSVAVDANGNAYVAAT